jgi:hypothetical protein
MSLENDASTFMDAPVGYFDDSVTKMHSIPRSELEPLQRRGVRTGRATFYDFLNRRGVEA